MKSDVKSKPDKPSKWTPELAYGALKDVIARLREAGIIENSEVVYIAANNGSMRLVATVDALGEIAISGEGVAGA